MFPAFLTTLLFSISAVCGNRSAKLLGGTTANFWRLSFAALLLGLGAHFFGTGLNGAALPVFLLSGIIGFGVGDMALFQALPRLGSRLSVLLTLCLSSPLAALMEWLWLGTRLTWEEMACGLAILAGVALALGPGSRAPGGGQHSARLRFVGALFGLLAAFCQALGAVLSRQAFSIASQAGDPINGLTSAYQRILGGVGFGAVLLLVVQRRWLGRMLGLSIAGPESADDEPMKPSWAQAWPWVMLNGLAGPALGVSCYQWALKTVPTGVVLPIVAITPLVIVPFSYHLEGERPTRWSLGGGLVAVAGAAALAWVSQHGR